MKVLWRRLTATPVMTGVIVVSLVAGIGANASVFSWIQARLLRPLPGVQGSAGLLLVEPVRIESDGSTGAYLGSSWLEYLDLRERVTQLPHLIATRMSPFYIGPVGATERVYGLLVSDNYFSALGVDAVRGRMFGAGDVVEEEPVAVISHGLWQSMFLGAADIVGQSLRVNGRPFTVVGVAPPAFQGTVLGLNFDVWVPATVAPLVADGTSELESRTARSYAVMGWPAEGAGVEQAQQEVNAVMASLAVEYPQANGDVRADVLPFWKGPRGPQRLLVVALVVLQGLMLLLLVAVCGNTASLFLARASARHREIGVRLALGATPRRIMVDILGETTLMGVAGAMGGALLAIWGTQVLVVLPLTGLPIRFQTALDWGGVLFAAALGLCAGIVVGAVPAWQLSRLDAQTAIRAGTRFLTRSRARDALMAAQAGLAAMVLVVAGLFLRSFQETQTTDPGFVRDGVLLAAFDYAGRPAAAASARGFVGRVLEDVRALPETEAVAVATVVPLDIHGMPSRVFVVDGQVRPDARFDQALANTVTPGYFDAMGIPLLAGHDFAPLESRDVPPEVIVNQAFVDRYLERAVSLEDAVGHRVDARGQTHLVVGVVRTSLYDAFGESPTPAMYFSYRNAPAIAGELHVRTRPGAEMALAGRLRRVVQRIDPELPLFNVRTLNDHVETNLVFRRVPARLFGWLGPLLLLLVGLGIYSLVSYSVSLRTAELGVRMALGATPARLEGDVLAGSLRVVTAGVAIGWLVVLVGVAALFPEQKTAVGVFVGVPVLIVVVAAVASWIPARRGAGVDPLVALRAD